MLEIQHLSAFYGQAQALFDVSLYVEAGQAVVLRGLNGAGKSTLLKSIIGLQVNVDKACSRIAFAGHELCGLQAYERAKLGIGYVAEDRRLFTDLTVRENLCFAGSAQEEQVVTLFPALKKMLNRNAAHMSGGEQQMLAIARTLMTQPKLLLLDEPLEGIAPVLVESIAAALIELKTQGMTLLIAEQNHAVDALADKTYTLVSGRFLQ
jgi:branched-chain amino acid transport system ATP-binding protein